ncbi:hypothetical protein B1729_16165 [Microbacterium sp. B35-04]|nr:hypothetical protein B1729_16165 [Microbacterium sp. B35-04]
MWYGILATWASTGYERGPLRYPTSGEGCGLRGGGCEQTFQDGTIYWAPEIGSFAVQEPMRSRYVQLGSVDSKLGYPTGTRVCGLRVGGCFQQFENGRVYSVAGQSHAVWFGMLAAWANAGYENGPLGYPIGEETCGSTEVGCQQAFEGGQILWSARDGARVILR